jgi:hypothetical protein
MTGNMPDDAICLINEVCPPIRPPKAGRFRPKRSRPGQPGYRGQLARLIRERPVFVNLAGGHNCGGLAGRGNGVFRANISVFAVFFRAGMAACGLAPYLETGDISDP